jgi:hypothetical protein
MTRNTVHHQASAALTTTWRRARRAAARLQPAAGQVKPLARTATAVARQQADKTRAWAAPQVERAGQVLQDSIAPKASSLLSAAAHRIDPAPPRRRRWRKLASAAAASAAAAFAAAVRSRLKAAAAEAKATDPAQAGGTASGAETAPGAETGPVAGTHNGQRSAGSDVQHGSPPRTS